MLCIGLPIVKAAQTRTLLLWRTVPGLLIFLTGQIGVNINYK